MAVKSVKKIIDLSLNCLLLGVSVVERGLQDRVVLGSKPGQVFLSFFGNEVLLNVVEPSTDMRKSPLLVLIEGSTTFNRTSLPMKT